MQKFFGPIFSKGTTPTFLRHVVSATYHLPFGKVWSSSICWSPSAKPDNEVECKIYGGWVKMQWVQWRNNAALLCAVMCLVNFWEVTATSRKLTSVTNRTSGNHLDYCCAAQKSTCRQLSAIITGRCLGIILVYGYAGCCFTAVRVSCARPGPWHDDLFIPKMHLRDKNEFTVHVGQGFQKCIARTASLCVPAHTKRHTGRCDRTN